MLTASILSVKPKPILDTIREEDKYGNTGDRLSFIGRGVVAGFEGFSNILNKVLDVSYLLYYLL